MTEPTTRGDRSHSLTAGRSRWRRWLLRLAAVLLASFFWVGPWPVNDASFVGGEYQRSTLERLAGLPGSGPAGPIRVGVAEVDLTPRSPRPLAGFIGQIRTPFEGVDTPCLARALTVETSSGAVTILTADLLLINARMARAVVERAELRPDQVYFTASHTHGGPGGWGNHPLEMLVAGAYDPASFESLVNHLADVVRRSRIRTVPAAVGLVAVQARDRQKNRVDPGLPTHDALSALIFRPVGGPSDAAPLAILAVFGAHATVSHPVPPRLGADYPAALVAALKKQTGAGLVLFASGAVGDASPARPRASSQAKSAEALGIALANDLGTVLPTARFRREVEVGYLRLDVDLPPVRLPFFASGLRFSPLLTWWIADRRTHLQALRIGPAVLVGFPGDYSGHLADPLAESTRSTGLAAVATSFNGDFRGYLVSEAVFRRRPCYETRWMSFYGPWTGEYLNDLARRMVEKLASEPVASPRPALVRGDTLPRMALIGLLAVAGAAGWRNRRTVWFRVKALGTVSVVVAMAAVLTFAVEPNWVDWAQVGLPGWLRLAGLPLGLVGLKRRDQGWTSLLLGSAGALLSANWLVVLIIGRIGVKSAIRDRAGELP